MAADVANRLSRAKREPDVPRVRRWLQAAAQKRQGEEGQAMFTLDGAIGVLSTFPPAENAAEMEMVAAGLRPRLSEAERVWLSETFRNIGGGSVANAVDEALDVKRR